MELTLDEALQQGIKAHKEGKLQDAERLYRAILQVQPDHPDANHNLGVLAVAVGKPLEAMPLFKLALGANPQIEQFWLSYIDVLIRLERFRDVEQILADAQKAGVSSGKLDVIHQQFQQASQRIDNDVREGIALSETGVQLADKKKNGGDTEGDAQPDSAPSQDQVASVLGHYQSGSFTEAESLALSLTVEFPAHSFGWKVLGALLKQAGKVSEALLPMRKAVELSPHDAAAHSNLGLTLGALRRLDEAEASLKEAIALKPDFAEAYYNLGNTLRELGRLEEAEASYRQATVIRPDYARAYSNLGLAVRALGRADEAEEILREVVVLQPESVGSHSNLADTLRALGRLDEAEASYRQAISLKPDFAEAHSNLGFTLQQLGKLDGAEASYRQVIALKPDSAEAHNNLGNVLNKLGRSSEAEDSYRQAIALNPDFTEAHSNLGNTLQELGRLDEADASHRQAIALKPDFAEAHSNLGNTLQELGRLDEADASHRQAIALKPNYAKAHYNWGNTLKKLGRLDEAATSFRHAIALKPHYFEAHNNLGSTYQELGKLDEAEASYRQTIVLKPDYAQAHSNLGSTLKVMGRLDEAEASYTQAIELKPDLIEALMNKWQLLFDKKEFTAALRVLDLCATQKSRARVLETLHALGRVDEIYKKIEMQAELDDRNLRVAAFSSFISQREKKATAHKFCLNPLSLIHVSNLSSHLEDAGNFVNRVIEELSEVTTIWEPYGISTVKGFQTPPHINLFANPPEQIALLKSIILNEIDAYYLKFHSDPCSFIQKWPSEKSIHGWHVILKEQGFQDSHIHPDGWLSGVIYLQVPPPLKKDEGAIEFSLNSKNYSDLKSPRLLHQPSLGDIVFFPSSLHHRTIPFTTSMDRITVSFDLMPQPVSSRVS